MLGLTQISHDEPPYVRVNGRSPLLYVVSLRKSWVCAIENRYKIEQPI